MPVVAMMVTSHSWAWSRAGWQGSSARERGDGHALGVAAGRAPGAQRCGAQPGTPPTGAISYEPAALAGEVDRVEGLLPFGAPSSLKMAAMAFWRV